MNPLPLLRLPGMLLDERLWSRVGAGADVVDLPLVGASLEDAVGAVLAVAPPRFDLAGLSLGAVVAMALVARAPGRVRRLVLLSCNGRAPTSAQHAGWDALEERALAGGFERITPEVLWPSLVAPSRRDDAGLAALAEAMAVAVGVHSFRHQLGIQRSREDVRPGLARFPGPATVVAGELDALCSLPMHEEIAAALPSAELVVVPGAGHLVPLEAPEAVAPLLADGAVGPRATEPSRAGRLRSGRSRPRAPRRRAGRARPA
ncbi:alpha/beta fold hydrolase [Desertihabitans brevis]|uniref:Alpha/beta fold hydrolase n=1 Tax=Desertihabitans brevis TaxID=2268447 RepID=A0A367YQG4_9ACTN|nr:alpha/beta hydrolase [Desertihabitans brevis]RCK68020.1 alpha/beta fold hydrolase [Desertihabitans brevis]